MSIASIASHEPGAAASAAAGSAVTGAAGEQRFLKLLVTQLNNQDPLNPMENAELTSQLAQMSTVSGIERLNGALQALLGQSSASQVLQAAAVIGHTVLAPGEEITGGAQPATFALELPAAAQSVQVRLSDADGRVVRTLDVGALPPGTHAIAWEGETDTGARAAAGRYRVQVVAVNEGAAVNATTLVAERVAAVTPDASGFTLDLASGRTLPLASVRKIF